MAGRFTISQINEIHFIRGNGLKMYSKMCCFMLRYWRPQVFLIFFLRSFRLPTSNLFLFFRCFSALLFSPSHFCLSLFFVSFSLYSSCISRPLSSNCNRIPHCTRKLDETIVASHANAKNAFSYAGTQCVVRRVSHHVCE